MDECFSCAGSALEHRTLLLEGNTVLEDVVICADCLSDFETVEWIEVLQNQFA
ncbi:hypothetical protein Hbl1158_14775 [Halobaculum sp. CBA1158]|uniref:hypothetical protein n=1 Tax=Halobaculum sp. CBA1158 TaxID=2904243 RepID=UPI001F1D7BAC|nr:hypothetical protein [Halobaculum sp. CBA1158]UIO99765.1 hypothetical protein Hbl1158_14775 [Halobaculum sp. CBA1158]